MASEENGEAGRRPGDIVERREHERYRVDWRARIKVSDWETFEQIAATSISEGGMFLRTSRPVAVGATVEISLALPNGDELALAAKVRRGEEEEAKAGIGVQILPEYRNELLAAVEIARLRRAKPQPVHDRARRPDVAIPFNPTGPVPRLKAASTVGIDFGVTFTGLSVAVGDTVFMVKDDEGRSQFPSIVSFPEQGDPIVGWEARELRASYPARTIGSIKRIVGRSFSDPVVAGFLHSAPYRTSAGPGSSIVIDVDEEQYAVPQVCALIIAQAKQNAERRLRESFTRAVLTVPVSYSEEQRSSIRRGAQLAGLTEVTLLEEPVAGALAYGYGQGKNEIIAAYDFGGGTFDFTVLDMSRDHYRVLVTDGDSWLGGDDFDQRLAESVANSFWRQTGIELQNRAVEWQLLLLACEQAKRTLSKERQCDVVLREIVQAAQPIDLEQRLERGALEQLCSDLFQQSLEVCQRALKAIGLEPRDVTELVVTGGTSRIPFIREGLERYFEREIVELVHPEDAIALGAGLFAARLARHAVCRVSS